MHAVVFQVDMKEGWENSAEQELEQLVRVVKAVPGFVRGAWTADGTRGLSFIVFESEEAARAIADNASMPPNAGATFRSVNVYQVVREA